MSIELFSYFIVVPPNISMRISFGTGKLLGVLKAEAEAAAVVDFHQFDADFLTFF